MSRFDEALALARQHAQVSALVAVKNGELSEELARSLPKQRRR